MKFCFKWRTSIELGVEFTWVVCDVRIYASISNWEKYPVRMIPYLDDLPWPSITITVQRELVPVCFLLFETLQWYRFAIRFQMKNFWCIMSQDLCYVYWQKPRQNRVLSSSEFDHVDIDVSFLKTYKAW